MRVARRRSIGRIGLAIVAIGIVWAPSDHAQADAIIHAQIGRVEFRVPKEFVSNWIKSRQHLGVEFSYPDIEPLGRFRFGDNVQQWISYQQAFAKKGGQAVQATLDPVLKPLQYTDAEKKYVANAICTGFAGGRIEALSEFDVDFWKCVRDDEIVVHRGEHRPTGLQFGWDRTTRTWRVTMINSEARIRTALLISQENLKDWKAITARAYATIDSWKK